MDKDKLKQYTDLIKTLGPYSGVLESFLNEPTMKQVMMTVLDDLEFTETNHQKMDLKSFFIKIRQLIFEMSEYYGWGETKLIGREFMEYWNEKTPMKVFPILMGEAEVEAVKEYNQIFSICNRIGTQLSNLTKEDFEYFNSLHKKYNEGHK